MPVIVQVVKALHSDYRMVQYSLGGKTFWRCRHKDHQDVQEPTHHGFDSQPVRDEP